MRSQDLFSDSHPGGLDGASDSKFCQQKRSGRPVPVEVPVLAAVTNIIGGRPWIVSLHINNGYKDVSWSPGLSGVLTQRRCAEVSFRLRYLLPHARNDCMGLLEHRVLRRKLEKVSIHKMQMRC